MWTDERQIGRVFATVPAITFISNFESPASSNWELGKTYRIVWDPRLSPPLARMRNRQSLWFPDVDKSGWLRQRQSSGKMSPAGSWTGNPEPWQCQSRCEQPRLRPGFCRTWNTWLKKICEFCVAVRSFFKFSIASDGTCFMWSYGRHEIEILKNSRIRFFIQENFLNSKFWSQVCTNGSMQLQRKLCPVRFKSDI